MMTVVEDDSRRNDGTVTVAVVDDTSYPDGAYRVGNSYVAQALTRDEAIVLEAWNDANGTKNKRVHIMHLYST